MKYTLLFAILWLAVALPSCKDDEECSAAWEAGTNDEYIAFQAAQSANNSNPTQATCEALVTAAQAYVDALQPYGSCEKLTGTDREDYDDRLDDAIYYASGVC